MPRFIWIIACLFAVTSCESRRESRDPTVIFAAASTQTALEEIVSSFQTANSIEVRCEFGPSSQLSRRIANGDDADLFLSADEEWADYLHERGLVAKRRDLLTNRLVVVVPKDSKAMINSLNDLRNMSIARLAIAGPAVPAGRYARQALEKADLTDAVRDRLLEGKDVVATRLYVARGEADAGFVYASDADNRVRQAYVVPEGMHQPIRYPLVQIQRDVGHLGAQQFADYLTGVEAEATFRAAGFGIAR